MISIESYKPFIKKFSDGGFFYIYDVNTNQIVEVEKSIYDIIDKCVYDNDDCIKNQKKDIFKSPDFINAIEEIKKARREHGLFSNFKPRKITLGIKNADGVRYLHEKGLKTTGSGDLFDSGSG